MEEAKEIVILDNEGKELRCDVLFTFEMKETGKSYVCYTDNSLDEEGNVKVFASIYDPAGEKGNLEAIETEEEWEVIDKMISQFSEEAAAEEESD